MSQVPNQASSGGKIPRDRRRLSCEQPYKRARTSTASMPATRRSPARAAVEIVDPEDPLPLSSIMQELALLRKSMETKFSEAEKKSDAMRGELVGKLDANDRAVSDLQMAVTDVTLSVDENQPRTPLVLSAMPDLEEETTRLTPWPVEALGYGLFLERGISRPEHASSWSMSSFSTSNTLLAWT